MPRYDYQCAECGIVFEVRHGFNDPAPLVCPNGHAHVTRLVTTTPRVLKGMAALTSTNASKDELKAKWAEETPKLKAQLESKLGAETVRKMGSGTLDTEY